MDTNVFLWTAFDPRRLSTLADTALADPDNELVVSAVTPWELGIAVTKRRIDLGTTLENFYSSHLVHLGARELAIQPVHAVAASSLPADHRDPFDRMLAAQARMESLAIVTNDRAIASLGADIIW